VVMGFIWSAGACPRFFVDEENFLSSEEKAGASSRTPYQPMRGAFAVELDVCGHGSIWVSRFAEEKTTSMMAMPVPVFSA